MPRKIRQLKADLRKAGAYQVSQEGSHTKWRHPFLPGSSVVLSGHDSDDAKSYQEKAIREMLQQIEQVRRSQQE